MDEETREMFNRLFEATRVGFQAQDTTIKELSKQVGINCKKLDNMNDILNDVKTTVNSISEIVTANGEGIEVLSERLNKLE